MTENQEKHEVPENGPETSTIRAAVWWVWRLFRRR